MATLTMKFEGACGEILESVVRRGIFKTKSEAVRNGVLGLGEKYGVGGGVIEKRNGIAIYRNPAGKYNLDDLIRSVSFKGERDLSSKIDEILYK